MNGLSYSPKHFGLNKQRFYWTHLTVISTVTTEGATLVNMFPYKELEVM